MKSGLLYRTLLWFGSASTSRCGWCRPVGLNRYRSASIRQTRPRGDPEWPVEWPAPRGWKWAARQLFALQSNEAPTAACAAAAPAAACGNRPRGDVPVQQSVSSVSNPYSPSPYSVTSVHPWIPYNNSSIIVNIINNSCLGPFPKLRVVAIFSTFWWDSITGASAIVATMLRNSVMVLGNVQPLEQLGDTFLFYSHSRFLPGNIFFFGIQGLSFSVSSLVKPSQVLFQTFRFPIKGQEISKSSRATDIDQNQVNWGRHMER